MRLFQLEGKAMPVRSDVNIIFSIFDHLPQWKFAKLQVTIAKRDSKFCHKSNELSKNLETLLKFNQSGQNTPNQVTLNNA